MELNLSLKRLLLLAACLTAFAILGGFTPPVLSDDSILDPRRVAKAWFYCLMLFIAGAVCVSVVDHFVGNIDRSNLRILYILLGVAVMIGSTIWLRGLKSAAASPSDQALLSHPHHLLKT